MDLLRPFAKWHVQNVSLRGIPEGKPIVDRFFDVYWDARRLRKDLITQMYQESEDKREMNYAFGIRSRVMFPISLQTASIAMVNGVTGQSLADIVVDQMFAYGEATIGDDFHDDVLIPRYLIKRDDITPEMIYEMIKSPDNLKRIAKDIGTFQDDSKKVFSVELLDASLDQAEIYRRRMSENSPRAYETYLKARDNLYGIQAKSLFISAALARGDVKRVREELGRGNGSCIQNTVRLGDKLALIGQENAAIVFEATQPQNMSEEKARDIKDGLRLFYHGSTLLKQFTEDDSLRLRKDIKNRADNLWVLLALQEYEDVSEEFVKCYLKSNPTITQEVLSPSVHEMRNGYEKLKDLGYDLDDLGLAIGLVTRQAERDMEKFERKLGVSLDAEWLKEAIELRESL